MNRISLKLLFFNLFLLGTFVGTACSDDTTATAPGEAGDGNGTAGNKAPGAGATTYADGKCARECALDAGTCTTSMNGVVVAGTCSNNQVCCHIPGTVIKQQCQGTCKMEWESCDVGTQITEGNCSGAQTMCCESAAESGDGNGTTDTDSSNTTGSNIDGNEGTSAGNESGNSSGSDNGTSSGSDDGTSSGNDDGNSSASDNDDGDGGTTEEVVVTDTDYIQETTWEDVLDEDYTVTAPQEENPITELATAGQYRVDAEGNITDGGTLFNVRCGNWFGLEGQHEPPDAENNASGAPMELYVGNMFWSESGRTIQQTMTEIKELGINMIRLPIAPQTLDPSDPQGIGSVQEGGVLKNAASVLQENARQAMEDFIILADDNDLKVLVDIHSCSNYVGWRAGRLDSAPPYVDAEREDYDFTREEYTCASGNDAYNEEKWLANITEIAGLSTSLGVDNIIGIDIFNEPWDYTWAEWKDLSEKAFAAIDAVNPDILIFVEGIGSKTTAGEEMPHGAEETNPNWGENFHSFKDAPLNIPKERLVLSPHTYGPSVFVQKQFVVGSVCQGLEGDEAGDNNCPIQIIPERLYPGWEEHFGYLRDQGYAMVIGEFGGNIDWPLLTRRAERERWRHIDTQVDLDWQNAFVDYMIEKNIQGCYWAINPESGDTGGLYYTPYRIDTNEDAWGTWGNFVSTKSELLQRYWAGLEANP